MNKRVDALKEIHTNMGGTANDVKNINNVAEMIHAIAEIIGGSASGNDVMGMIADPYDATATYAVGAFVTHDNKLYKCSTAIETAEAWTAAHWTQTTIMAEV